MMESHISSEVTSVDEENSSLMFNDDSSNFDKTSDLAVDSNGYDENEDTRSELKFDDGNKI